MKNPVEKSMCRRDISTCRKEWTELYRLGENLTLLAHILWETVTSEGKENIPDGMVGWISRSFINRYKWRSLKNERWLCHIGRDHPHRLTSLRRMQCIGLSIVAKEKRGWDLAMIGVWHSSTWPRLSAAGRRRSLLAHMPGIRRGNKLRKA